MSPLAFSVCCAWSWRSPPPSLHSPGKDLMACWQPLHWLSHIWCPWNLEFHLDYVTLNSFFQNSKHFSFPLFLYVFLFIHKIGSTECIWMTVYISDSTLIGTLAEIALNVLNSSPHSVSDLTTLDNSLKYLGIYMFIYELYCWLLLQKQ